MQPWYESSRVESSQPLPHGSKHSGQQGGIIMHTGASKQVSHLEVARGQGACFVHRDGVDVGQALEHAGAAHEDAVPGGGGDGAHAWTMQWGAGEGGRE